MDCRDVMTEEVRWIPPTDTIQRAAEIMREANIGFLPVCGSDKSIVGTLTDRDLVVRALAIGAPSESRVEQFITRDAIRCHPDDDLEVAENLMSENEIERVIVTDYQDRLVGVISLSDLMQFDIDEGARIAQAVTNREAPSPF